MLAAFRSVLGGLQRTARAIEHALNVPQSCVICHRPIRRQGKRGQHPMYCSPQCRHRSKNKHRSTCATCGKACTGRTCVRCFLARGRQLGTCDLCGNPTTTKQGVRCQTCRTQIAHAPSVCRYCQQAFIPKAANRRTYCCRAHCFAYLREHGRPELRAATAASRAAQLAAKEAARERTYQCVICGETFISRYKRKHCYRSRCRCHSAYSQPRTFDCWTCGRTVTTHVDKRRHFCSYRCSKWYSRARRKWFSDWPKGERIPADFIRARRLYGRAWWAITNRSAFLEYEQRESEQTEG